MTVVPGAWVLLATIPLQVGFGISAPLATTVLAQRSPATLRATALSFQDMVLGVSLMIAGVIGSLLLDHASAIALGYVAMAIALVGVIGTVRCSLVEPAGGNAYLPTNTGSTQ